MRGHLALSVLLAVSWGRSASAGPAGKAPTPAKAPAPTPAPKPAPTPPKADAQSRAKSVLDKQVAALGKGDQKGFTETFAPTAIVLVPTAREASSTMVNLVEDVSRAYGNKFVTSAKPTKLVAGGVGGAVWFAAELGYEYEGSKALAVRALELVDGSGRVVAASFGDIMAARALANKAAISPATSPGPLTKFLTSPSEAAVALSSDAHVIVQGTDPKEYAVGPEAAKKLLSSWSKLTLTLEGDKVHEVRTKDWGFAMATVNYPSKKAGRPNRLSALVIGVPTGDKWSVVAIHYAPL